MSRDATTDWERIKAEYITGEMSYRDLADKYGVTVNAVHHHATPGGWYKERMAYRKRVAKKAVRQAENKDVKTLTRLLSIIDTAIDQVERSLRDDPDQLHRHILRDEDGAEGEEVLRRTDWQAVRYMAAAVKDMTATAHDLLRIRTRAEEDVMELSWARLELDRQKAAVGADADEAGTGVVYLPPVADAAPPPEEAGEAAEDGGEA